MGQSTIRESNVPTRRNRGPGREGDTACNGGRYITKIEHDESKSAAMNEMICDFECMLGFLRTPDPKHAVEISASIRR